MSKAALIISFIILSASVQSCNFDSCHEVVCANDGICVDGKCMCRPGYEGIDCDVASAYKFQGTWAAFDTSLYYFSASYLSKITRSPTEPTTILVNNLRNWGSNLTFSFFADGNTVSLNPAAQTQSIHTLISANGIISADGKSLSITYTYQDSGNDTTVTGSWTLR